MMRRFYRRGFTLIEVLISIVVMTIAFFAVLAVQGSALIGYTAARDSTEATELLRATVEVITAESQAWTNPNTPPSPAAASFPSTWGTSPFRFDNILVNIAPGDNGGGFTEWEWTHLHEDPIDSRIVDDAEVMGRKYCVYARAGYLPVDMSDLNQTDGSGNTLNSPIMRVQVAVVYTGRTGFIDDCDSADITSVLTPENLEDLELEGLRAVFGGTVVVRREQG